MANFFKSYRQDRKMNDDRLPFFRLPSKYTTLDDQTDLVSPMSRIHTAEATNKRRKNREFNTMSSTVSPTRSPPKLKPIQFVLVPTMLTRKTKRNMELGGRDRDEPLTLQQLSSSPRSPEARRSDMLVALVRKKKEKNHFSNVVACRIVVCN